MSESNVCTVELCDRPASDGFVCRTCLKKLEVVFDEMPWLIDELGLVMARESKYSEANGKAASKIQPIPFNIAAGEALRNLQAVLTSWTRMLADENAWPLPPNRLPSIVNWLAATLETIRCHEAGGDLVSEISACRATAMYAIDRPAEQKYLGPCGYVPEVEGVAQSVYQCEATLWGKVGDHEAVCRTCGAEWSMEKRVKDIDDQAKADARDRIYLASEAAMVLIALEVVDPWTDEAKLTDRIRKMAAPRKRHGLPDQAPRLFSRATLTQSNGRRRPGYRLGDIMDLLDQPATRRKAA